jgi:hypothetical protein
MSEGEKPIPVPRPRQLKATDETNTSSKFYENYTIPSSRAESIYDNVNAQLKEIRDDVVHRPVPTPRARTSIAKQSYENSSELNNRQHEVELSPPKTTGAIRKVPNIPSVKNNFDETDQVHESKDFDVLSQTSSASGKSAGDSKFQTPSPG